MAIPDRPMLVRVCENVKISAFSSLTACQGMEIHLNFATFPAHDSISWPNQIWCPMSR